MSMYAGVNQWVFDGDLHLQGGLSSPWVDVSSGSPVVIYEVRDAIDREPHLPTFRQCLLI